MYEKIIYDDGSVRTVFNSGTKRKCLVCQPVEPASLHRNRAQFKLIQSESVHRVQKL